MWEEGGNVREWDVCERGMCGSGMCAGGGGMCGSGMCVGGGGMCGRGGNIKWDVIKKWNGSGGIGI